MANVIRVVADGDEVLIAARCGCARKSRGHDAGGLGVALLAIVRHARGETPCVAPLGGPFVHAGRGVDQ